MNRFVDVELGQQKFSVLYTAQALINAPIEVALAAIEQEERIFILRNLKFDVLNQVGLVFERTDGPFEYLSEYQDQLRLADDMPEQHERGIYVWHFELLCPECEGSGTAVTRGGREIDCPCCAANGHTHTFAIFANSDGRFIGFPPNPVWKPALSNFYDYDFDALPLWHALDAVRCV